MIDGTIVEDEEVAGFPRGDAPLDFMGFDMNIPREELEQTIEAWQDLIKRLSRDADNSKRAAELIMKTRLRSGVAHAVLQNWPAATQELEQVCSAPGAHPALVQTATWLLSAVYSALGQYERTLACWSEILTEFESVGKSKASLPTARITMLYVFRAQIYAEQGEYLRAIADCDRAEKYHPDCGEVFSVRGLCNADLGNMERAIADCDRSIQLEPETARCYRRRGVVHTMRRDFEKAIADFDDALKLDPSDELAQTGRSKALLGYALFGMMDRVLDDATEKAPEQDGEGPSEIEPIEDASLQIAEPAI